MYFYQGQKKKKKELQEIIEFDAIQKKCVFSVKSQEVQVISYIYMEVV